MIDFDVDIDMADRNQILNLINHIPANAHGKKHNTGVYFQNIPYNPLLDIAAIDHKQAENDDWFKVDFLNNSIYKDVKSETDLIDLMNAPILWELLEHEEVISQLAHIGRHVDLVQQYKPDTVEKLAMLLAIIRPGKRHLQGCSWDVIEKSVWQKPDDDTYYFKKAHAIAYAVSIVVQLNILSRL